MEIISMDIRTFDTLMARVKTIEEKADMLCKRQEDLGLKKWLDNQEVCDILGISKRTLQESAGSRTSCSTSRKTWRKYYSRIIMQIQRNYEPLFH